MPIENGHRFRFQGREDLSGRMSLTIIRAYFGVDGLASCAQNTIKVCRASYDRYQGPSLGAEIGAFEEYDMAGGLCCWSDDVLRYLPQLLGFVRSVPC